jgi:hypothetical protein
MNETDIPLYKHTFVTEFFEIDTVPFNRKNDLIKNIKKLNFKTIDCVESTYDKTNNVLENKGFEKFKNFITNYIQAINLNFLNKKKFAIGNSWFQLYKKEQHHTFHTHGYTENQFSLIYYIKVTENSSKTVFQFPGYPYIENQQRYKIKPKENKLIIFPAYIPHYVEPNKDKSRLIFSCNFKTF